MNCDKPLDLIEKYDTRLLKIEEILNKIILKLDKLEKNNIKVDNKEISFKDNIINIIDNLCKLEFKPTIGFIILRHVNSEKTNIYWQFCYDSIRKFYPENNIIIIDDNSDYNYITSKELYKVKIIRSEYPGRGELLPYYYYLSNKLFDVAFIIHDSVFIQKPIDICVNKYQITWDFGHGADQIEDETKMINLFNDDKLLKFYQDQSLWTGCFGGMTTITHDFLTQVNNKYNLSTLIDAVKTRHDRMSFERVFACLLQIEAPQNTRFGNIHNYMPWATSYEDRHLHTKLPLLKVWTGR
jgi:hypothetical protein